MAVTVPGAVARPEWPGPGVIDPSQIDVHFDPLADEFLVYFAGKPVPSFSDPFHVDGFEDVAILIDLQSDDSSTNEVVGIQVMPLLVGAVQKHPEWAVLAWGALTGFRYEEEMLRTALAAFVAEVRDLFERHWTPPPPIEEQLARLPRSERNAGGQGDG